jgi:chromate transporter
MGAVAAGLILATAIKLMATLRASLLGPWLAAAFVVATFVTIALLRLPLIWVVIGLGGLAIAIAWQRLR